MRKSTKKLLRILTLLLVVTFTLETTSCTTLRKKENNLVWFPVPDPIVNGEDVVEQDEDLDKVQMPKWYWRQVEMYIIITEANIEKLK